jgi:hypothetical protein
VTTVHRYWGPGSAPYPWIGRVVRALHPAVMDWTDATLPASTAGWLDSHAAQVPPADRYRHRANLVRLWLLFKHGGIWLDMDFVPFGPLESFPRPWAAAHGGLCNCAMGFDAGDPLLAEALAMAEAAPDGGPETKVAGEEALWALWRDRVTLRQLPFDSAGVAIPDSTRWGVHLFATTAGGDRGSHS